MTKQFLALIFAALTFDISFGQKIGDYYVSIPSDSSSDCRLNFITDSTVELSNVPRHMSGRLAIVFKYTSTDSTIEILPDLLKKEDSLSLMLFRLSFFIKPKVTLTKIDGGFIDYSKSLIYIREKDFGKNQDIAYYIEGKTYIQKGFVTDVYGLIKKSPKQNRSLRKGMKTLGKNPDNLNIEIVKGLKAYERFGIKRVYGVMVITKK